MERYNPCLWWEADLQTSQRLISLLQFVASSIQSECIPHYFIRNINLVKVMNLNKKETESLGYVANYIQKMILKENFAEKFIFDQIAYNTMVLNENLHNTVLRDRLSKKGSAKQNQVRPR